MSEIDYDELIAVAEANGYYHHLSPFVDRIASLESSLRAKEEECERLKVQINHMEADGEQAIHDSEHELSRLRSDNERIWHQNVDLIQKCDRLQTELSEMKATVPESDQCGPYHAWMEQRVGRLIEEKANLESELSAVTIERDQALAGYAREPEEGSKMAGDDLTSRLREAEGLLTEIQNDCSDMNRDPVPILSRCIDRARAYFAKHKSG